MAGRARAKPTPGSKTCEFCSEEFRRRDGEQAGDYRRRKTCSKECRRRLVSRGNAVHLDIFGVSLTYAQIGEMLGLSKGAIRERVCKGKDPLTGKKTKDSK